MLAQTHLAGAFEVFGYLFSAGIAGFLIGAGTVLASIGARPLMRSVLLTALLPGFAILAFWTIGGFLRSAERGLFYSVVLMLVIALASYYWPEKPSDLGIKRTIDRIATKPPPRL
jgi:hypothetical protein